MNRRILITMLGLALISFPLALPATAEVHTGVNVLGLATTPDADGSFEWVDQPLGDFEVHLLVYGYDAVAGIAGWECRVLLPAGVLVREVTLVGKPDPISASATDLSLRAFPLIPLLPSGGVVHLATLHLTLTDGDSEKEFRLAPHSTPEVPGRMSFARETSGANLIEFKWPGGCEDCPVFRIVPSAQPVIAASWDGVKSLYR